jgi:hypothetical protein
MATTTPNYGWTVPTSTDLVKDGATAIETLGDAIDASMNTALGTKKAGMVLLNTTSFSAVASQSINNVFSATYDNYLILTNVTSTNAADKQINMRLRVSGADDSAGNYFDRFNGYTDFNSTDNFRRSSQTSWFMFECDSTRTGADYVHTMSLRNPFSSVNTTYLSQADGNVAASGAQVSYSGGGLFNATTSFTGFTILASAGDITGKVVTYGFNV